MRFMLLGSVLALLLLTSAVALSGQLGGSPAPKVAARRYENPVRTPIVATPAATATPSLSWAQIEWVLQALVPPAAVPMEVASATPQPAAPGSQPPASAPQQVVGREVAPPASPALEPPTTSQPPEPTVFVPPPAVPTPTPTPAPSCPTADQNSMATALFNAINDERAQAGVPALTLNSCVVFVAQYRTDDMAANNYFSHTSLDGGGAFALLGQYRVPHGWAGENLARNNYPTDEAVGIAIHDLMASPSHRDNILATHFTMLGVGYTYDGVGMHYFAMVFIGPP